MSATAFDKKAAEVKKTLVKYEGTLPKDTQAKDGLLSAEQVKAAVLTDMKTAVKQMDSYRKGDQVSRATDVTFAQYAKKKFGFSSLDSLYTALDINPSFHTMENLSSMSDFDDGYRWLKPEIVREAVRLGLRRNPVYSQLIAAEESVSQTRVVMPSINMSDAIPEKVNEGETIPVGSVSFGEKDVKLSKIGTGFKVSDEVQKYVSLNVLSLYLQDAGVQLGLGLDVLAIDTLINGDNGSGSYSAPVIGVENTANGITYKDMLRVWLRMGQLGRTPDAMLSSETPALDILMMDEFRKWSQNTNTAHKDLKITTPIPQSQNFLIHGAMPSSNILAFNDKRSSLLKLNATGLLVESERIAEKQLNGTYVTITTGFAKLFQDAFVLLDGSLPFSSNGYPEWMDTYKAENVLIK